MRKALACLLAAVCLLWTVWAAASQGPGLTAQEKEWLNAHPEIRLGTVPEWAPLSMRDRAGRLSGIAGGYKGLLEQRLGIHFTLADEFPWSEVLDRVRNRKLDVVMLLGETPERDSYLEFTQVLVDIPYVIIAGEGAADVEGIEELAGKRVAVAKGFVSDEWLTREHPELKLVRKEDTRHALEAVAVGEADAYVGSIAAGNFAIDKYGLVRLKVIGHAAFTNNVRIGVRKDWPELRGILDKGLASITPQERLGIWNSWVTLEQDGIDKRIVYALVSVLVLLMIGLLVWRNHSLRKAYDTMEDKVRERTGELERANDYVTQEVKRYETLLRTAGDGIHVIDSNGDVLQVNDAFCRMLGYTQEEMRGMNVAQWDAQWSREELKARIEELGERSLTFETRQRRRDGGILDVEVDIVGVDIGGQHMVYCSARDISRRKLAERSLAESEARLNELFENMSSGVAVYRVDADGQFVFSSINRAAERIDKVSRDEILGRKLSEVFPGATALGLPEVLRRVWESGVPETFPVAFYRDGRISGWRDNYVYRLPGGEVVAIYDDVTEQKRAQDELERLNRDFVSLLDNTSDFIYFKDKESRIRFCSRSMALIVGHQDWRELIGKHDLEIFPEETAKIYYEEELPVFREGKPLFNKVDPYLNERGERCWVNTNKWPVFDADGETVVGIFGISRDITEQVRAEEALRKSEELFKEMTETSPLAIYMSEGVEQRGKYVNPAFVSLFGYTLEDVPSVAAWWPLAYPDVEYRRQVAEEWQRRAERAIETKSAIAPIDVYVTCKDGSRRYISWGFTSVGDQNWAFGQDLTDRKRAEDALRESEQHFRNMFHKHSSIMLLIEPESGAIIDANTAAEHFYGYSVSELLGMRIDQINALTPEEVTRERHLALEEERNYFVFPHRLKSGEIRTVEVHSTPVEGGGKQLLFSIIHDITERKKVENALLRSNADLEQFAYSISHDLRAPLRAVSGHLQLLERALKVRLDEDDRQNMAFALDGAKRMDEMIKSMLEYSRVGRMTESRKWMASRDSLDEALGYLAPEIEKTGAKVETRGEWPQVYASRDELMRLFQNLMANALIYHEPEQAPRIEVTSSVEARLWRVSVRDHGIGIDPKQTERLFKFFSRLQARSRFEGTGMGLALCRRIAEHHGGRIWVESEGEGKGCNFVFEMPLDSEPADSKGELS